MSDRTPPTVPPARRMPARPSDEQRRRIRRTTFLLVAVALGLYVWFIVSSIMKARH